MPSLSYLKDKDFLKALDNVNNKFYWVKIEVLDMKEKPLSSIEGRVQPGSSISISGDSAVRRTCNITFIAEEDKNDLTNINNLLSANKKIKIYEGIKNDINSKYDNIIWFPLGVFVITQPSISNSSGGCTISLSCKDKMCLLNGECAGGLPTSVTFDSYNQVIGKRDCGADDPAKVITEPNDYTVYSWGPAGNKRYKIWSRDLGWTEEEDDSLVGTVTSVPQRFYDIIQSLVHYYGGEDLDKIFINDVPLEIKQIVRYTGSDTLYYNSATGFYTTDESYLTPEETWRNFKFNDDVGYIYTDFTYPGSLVSGIGENVCSILDKIKNTLGNFEYFYDVEGNFVFQEVRNYLNNSYDPTDAYRLDNVGKMDNGRYIEIASNGLSINNNETYKVDFYSNTKSVYTFTEGNGLIISSSNSPDYTNLKNDFHIWGENSDGYAIHYHVAIKQKPIEMNTYSVVYLTNEDGDYTGGLRLANPGEYGEAYTPEDWRAELYLRGLEKQGAAQVRPDIYEQELLDLFDLIYDFKEKKFKSETVQCPNDLIYFFDYIEPAEEIYDCSVDSLYPKVYSYQESGIKKLYNTDIPNMIMISLGRDPDSRAQLIQRCMNEGQPYSNVSEDVYSHITIGTIGYTAQEVSRSLLYQYTNYNESISLQSVPIYYLDVNTRITVQDQKAGIYGDYIIKNITLPLNAESSMSITAVKALERI